MAGVMCSLFSYPLLQKHCKGILNQLEASKWILTEAEIQKVAVVKSGKDKSMYMYELYIIERQERCRKKGLNNSL